MLRINKIKEKFILIFLFMFTIFFSGCTSTNKNIVHKNKEFKYIKVVDSANREVRVPREPNRIACLFSTSADIVTMLGDGERIVAVSLGQKRAKVLMKICPSIKDASTPKGGGHFNIEELIKSNPDLIFCYTDIIKNKTVKNRLDTLKIPYVVIDYKNIKEQKYVVNMIGKILNKEKKATEFIEYYDKCINRVSKIVSKIPKEKRVRVYHGIDDFTRTDAKDTLPAEWIKVSGGINVSVEEPATKLSKDSFEIMNNKLFVSLEQIFLWNPEVIIGNGEAIDMYINSKKQFKKIKAVKENKVYLLPNGVTRWGHPYSIETPLAILWTAKMLYPDKFKDLNIKLDTKEFYREFYNYNLSDELTDKILSGKGLRKDKKKKL